jgi:type IV pilus assembly protein PilP
MSKHYSQMLQVLSLLGTLLVTACSGELRMLETQDYVRSVVNRPPGKIEPPPEFMSFVNFTYSAASLRSPFDVPLDAAAAQRQLNSQVKPDENRPKEYLEGYPVGDLVMVGTLTRNGQMWGLIKDITNNISRVTVGNYMGRNHGRITQVAETQIDLMEIVPAGDGGWIERPQSVVMAEQ